MHCTFALGAPSLSDDIINRSIIEGTKLTVDNLEQESLAFPFPLFQWTRNDIIASNNSGLVSYGYPTVSFSNISRQDAGTYTLFAENFRIDEPDVQIGNDTATFILEVLCT